MANTTEMRRLMCHAADLLDACDPGINGGLVQYHGGGAMGREAVERAIAEAVAMGMASMVLRMVAAAMDDEPSQGGEAGSEATPNDLQSAPEGSV
jgi:hypothetical protein